MSGSFIAHRHVRLNNGSIAAVTVAYIANLESRVVEFGFAFCSPSEKCFSKKKGRDGGIVTFSKRDENGYKITEQWINGRYQDVVEHAVYCPGAYERLEKSPFCVSWPQGCSLIDLILVTLMRISVAPTVLSYSRPSWLTEFTLQKFKERLEIQRARKISNKNKRKAV